MMQNSIVPILENNLPTFVKDGYPRFVKFLRDYYEWMESEENYHRVLLEWQGGLEPSKEQDFFLDNILQDLGWDFKGDILAKKSLLLSGLRDFYLSRGTPASFDFIWKVLFSENVEIRYPREELLIPSSADFGERFFLFVELSDAQRESEELQTILGTVKEKGGSVLGLTSRSKVDLEAANIILGYQKNYLELEILQPIIPFLVGEVLRVTVDGVSFDGTLSPSMGIKIENGGAGYKVGDQVTVRSAAFTGRAWVSSVSSGFVDFIFVDNPGKGYSVGDRIRAIPDGNGFGFSARVSSLGWLNGIDGIEITSGGYGYETPPVLEVVKKPGFNGTGAVLYGLGNGIGSIKEITFSEPCLGWSNVVIPGNPLLRIHSERGAGAILRVEENPVFSYKSWKDRKGVIGENSRTVDSFKYQQFSYSISSQVQSSNYDGFVNEFLHPVGFQRFNTFEIISEGIVRLEPETTEKTETFQITYEYTVPVHWEVSSTIETLETLGLDAGGDILGVVTNSTVEVLRVT